MSALLDLVAEIARPRTLLAVEDTRSTPDAASMPRPYDGRFLFEDDSLEFDIPYWVATARELDDGCSEIVLAPVSEWSVVQATDSLVDAIGEQIAIDLRSRGRL
jgi:hypothetical protein